MQVIWHEAVRNDCELVFPCCAQHLLEDQVHRFIASEHVTAVIRAECQGISIKTEEGEPLEMARCSGLHDPAMAICDPCGRG
jgi:hypothetical protein